MVSGVFPSAKNCGDFSITYILLPFTFSKDNKPKSVNFLTAFLIVCKQALFFLALYFFSNEYKDISSLSSLLHSKIYENIDIYLFLLSSFFISFKSLSCSLVNLFL